MEAGLETALNPVNMAEKDDEKKGEQLKLLYKSNMTACTPWCTGVHWP